MAQKDYPELEGKEILFKSNVDIEAVVAGVNFDIGITIEQKDTSNSERCVCLHGPAYKPGSVDSNYVSKSYKTEFYTAVAMIKKGVFKASMLKSVERLKAGENYDHPFGTVETCSFT